MTSKPSSPFPTEHGSMSLLAAMSSVAFETSIPTQSGFGNFIITLSVQTRYAYGQVFGFQMSGSGYAPIAYLRTYNPRRS